MLRYHFIIRGDVQGVKKAFAKRYGDTPLLARVILSAECPQKSNLKGTSSLKPCSIVSFFGHFLEKKLTKQKAYFYKTLDKLGMEEKSVP